MSILTIVQQVAAWNLPKATRIMEEALASFKADTSRTPAQYIEAGLKSETSWGAVFAAYIEAQSGYVVPRSLQVGKKRISTYAVIGKKYHLLTISKNKATMKKSLDALFSAYVSEKVSTEDTAHANGTAYKASLSAMTKEAKSASLLPIGNDQEEALKLAEELFAFATANLSRFKVKVSK